MRKEVKSMKTVKTQLFIDVNNKQLQQTAAVKQYDTARELHVTLTDGGKPYEIASECYAMFAALKPDGNVILNNCTVEINTVIYAFTAQTTVTAGIMPCEIKIYGADNALLTSHKFFLRIEKAVYGGSAEDKVESSSEFNALTELTDRVIKFTTRVFKTETLTGDAGTDALVTRTYDEKTNTVTYNFTIPRGDKGEKGDKGDKGDPVIWLRPEDADESAEMPDGYWVELDPNGTAFEFDEEPTENSDNLLTSGAVYDAIAKIPVALPYTGEYSVTPLFASETVLETKDKSMTDNVTVQKMPQFEVSNDAGGKTLILGDEYYGE